MTKIKQVLVCAKYLNMRKGKMVAQGAHASMKHFVDKGSFENIEDTWFLTIPLTNAEYQWLNGKFTKVCLGIDSEENLLSILKQAEDAGLPCALIVDSGLTEFHGVPTKTFVSIGPATEDKIDPITGHLKPL